MTPEQSAKRREYTINYKKRWAAIGLPIPVYERIAKAAKERSITQAQVIERACAEVGR